MSDVVRAILVLFLLVLLVIIPNIKLVRDHQAMVIERFGKFHKVIEEPGIYILIPLFERAVQSVELTPISHHLNLDEDYRLDYIYEITDVKSFVYQAIDSLHSFHEEILQLFIYESFDSLLHKVPELALPYGMKIIECKICNLK
jgi:regulator of protease activity HflC (stomatin/prohibitin superfamily)